MSRISLSSSYNEANEDESQRIILLKTGYLMFLSSVQLSKIEDVDKS